MTPGASAPVCPPLDPALPTHTMVFLKIFIFVIFFFNLNVLVHVLRINGTVQLCVLL